jgi:hypothetical protein
MDAEFFPKQHNAVPGFHHIAANFAAHLAGAGFNLRKGSARRFRSIRHAGLESRGLRLQING